MKGLSKEEIERINNELVRPILDIFYHGTTAMGVTDIASRIDAIQAQQLRWNKVVYKYGIVGMKEKAIPTLLELGLIKAVGKQRIGCFLPLEETTYEITERGKDAMEILYKTKTVGKLPPTEKEEKEARMRRNAEEFFR